MKLFALVFLASLTMVSRAYAQTSPSEWQAEILDDGWTLLHRGSDQIVFYKNPVAVSQGQNRTLWERFEFQEPNVKSPPAFLSMVALEEFDCKLGRSRVIQMTTFEKSNLNKSNWSSSKMDSDWSVPIPNTFAEAFLKVACHLD